MTNGTFRSTTILSRNIAVRQICCNSIYIITGSLLIEGYPNWGVLEFSKNKTQGAFHWRFSNRLSESFYGNIYTKGNIYTLIQTCRCQLSAASLFKYV